ASRRIAANLHRSSQGAKEAACNVSGATSARCPLTGQSNTLFQPREAAAKTSHRMLRRMEGTGPSVRAAQHHAGGAARPIAAEPDVIAIARAHARDAVHLGIA